MKIACPQCGQHYEVEAGTLDRYFRCTECQMLFRGLNAKPVKVRKFRRKNKAAEEPAENTGEALLSVEDNDPAATTAAVAVEDMEKDDVEAEADFWEKNLREDAIVEKAGKISFRSVNWSAVVPVVCIVFLIITFVMAMLAVFRVNALTAGYKAFGDKGAVYRDRLAKIEQNIEKLQVSLQNMTSEIEKMERIVAHVNVKANDQTLARRVDEIAKDLDKCSRNTEEIKKLSAAVADCQAELQKIAGGETLSSKQRKMRR